MVQVQWKHGQWAHHQREAESMKEEQRPLCPRGAPLCTSHHHINSLHWPCMLCVCKIVCVCVYVCTRERNVCILACISRQVLPLGISALWICPPKMAWLSAIILKQAAFSPVRTTHPLLSKSIFLHGLLCILTTLHHTLVCFCVETLSDSPSEWLVAYMLSCL